MHISEGVLKPDILVPAGIITAGLTAYLLYKIKPNDIVHTACMSAVFFVGSFVHFPLGPSSLHLVLGGIVGAFSGRFAFLSILVALLFQGIFFGFGGLSTLGVNTLIIGLPAIFGAYFVRLGNQNNALKAKLFYFLAGFVPVAISSILLSVVLLLNGDEFRAIASLVLLTNSALCVIEGLICALLLSFIAKTYPEFLPCQKSL